MTTYEAVTIIPTLQLWKPRLSESEITGQQTASARQTQSASGVPALSRHTDEDGSAVSISWLIPKTQDAQDPNPTHPLQHLSETPSARIPVALDLVWVHGILFYSNG